ncbi:MAG: carbohydrate binding family 9 domain-containing protein [Deltaproteobacteria bacterium]|nr:carbohydrate binding family 9 domain-containing protein [Deltaproteobacteria bacterium]
MRRVALSLVVLLAALGGARAERGPTSPTTGAARASGPAGAAPELRAVRVPVPPKIDGRLDDPAWRVAPVYTGFRQKSPHEGAPATEETEVRVVYDDRALYVGVFCRDRQPATIRPRLGRRDSIPQSDWVAVAIDPYFDRKSAFSFVVNNAGVQSDVAMVDGGDDDYAWDGVWTAEVRIGGGGWTAELRIPFATLRFSPRAPLRFGVHVRRFLNRLQETSEWPLIPARSTSVVGNFATLTGLHGIKPGLRLQMLPYGRLQWNPSYAEGSLAPRRAVQPNAGLDVKYGVTGQLTLDVTFNPDFGQVEVDPDVINLTAVETFYAEKRPFFTEGAEILKTPLFNLLHTRRIGAPAPDPDPLRPDGSIVSVESLPRIWGAAKLTGRLAPGTSIGLLSALVDATDAVEEAGGGRTTRAAAPLTHFGALRLRQQLGGPSSAAVMLTMVQRANPENALPSSPTADHYVAAADVDLRGAGPYSLTAQLAGSTGTCDEDRQERHAACVPVGGHFRVGRTGGERLRVYLEGRFLSPDFSYNHAGYQPLRDVHQLYLQGTWRTPRPWWRAAANEQTLYAWAGWNTAGDFAVGGVGHTSTWKWRSLWSTVFDWGTNVPRFDPLETRYGRIPYHRQAAPWVYLYQTTNESLWLSGRLESWAAEEGGAWDVKVGPLVTLLAGQRLQVQLGVACFLLRNRERWIDTVTVDHVEHYVFNRIHYDLLDATLRVTGTIVRGLTAQFYGQLLHGAGRYPRDGYRELTDPRTLAPLTVTYGTADFTHTSLIANLVLRWEYRPLSTIYLVWTHASTFDAGDVKGSKQLPGTFGLGGAVRDLWHVTPGDVVMLKAAYLFQL